MTPQFMFSVLQIIWIDILLSGDNAVVIALACRSLPPRQRRVGIVLGAAVAVGLRIIFALMITQLLAMPFLKLVGGLLLLWIAVKLIAGEEEEEKDIQPSETLWKAVRTIAIADAVMSLDNVVAIAAASHGNVWLFVFGLLFSIPLIVMGATLVMTLLARFPILIWAGAVLLGWVAGHMLATDPWLVEKYGQATMKALETPTAIAAALFVLAAGFFMRRRNGAAAGHDKA
ncbi:MAG: TerC family protein [Burkholderiales bacterium]|nr:TerC family protein [Burkholderiales bacterium]